MTEPIAALRSILRHAKAAARRRLVLRVLVDGALGGIAMTTIAALCAGLTLRGDLAVVGWATILTLGATVLLVSALLEARGFGPDLRAARRIAAYPAPLGNPASAARARAHRLLRHEWLGATELATHLDAAATGPHAGSPRLAAQYIADVAQRLSAKDVDPRRALPPPRWQIRGVLLGGFVLLGVAAAASGPLVDGVGLMLAGVDGRPPSPPEPVWSGLRLRLEYPAHTQRPVREVPNPTGALRVPAGTVISVEMDARQPAAAARVVVNHDAQELSDAPPPEVVPLLAMDHAGMQWSGMFTVRATGTWTIVLLDDEGDAVDGASRRSAALPLQEEPDRAPEVELLPLPESQREVRETDRVEVRFVARDDFGLGAAELVYQLPDGSAHRLQITPPLGGQRHWKKRHDWDLSQIPVTERSEVLYWIEVRDNDPGLGLVPLPDPPGKLSRSATQRLLVRDDEAEHASNVVRLRDIRDLAVDLLAARMTTRAFPRAADAGAPAPPPIPVRAALSRDLLHRSAQLLARLAEAIDALSMDALARERDVATLTGIHQRLARLHRTELDLHAEMPPRHEHRDPDGAGSVLQSLHGHNREEIPGLEDEIIRLDDLVDGQIIERLEGLIARLEATQRKLVELLEQLEAGDESVRSVIEQLEQRRREDMRRIAEARAMLRKEVEEEFMNLDAFEVLERLQQQEQLSEMLRRGEVGQALERARGELGELQGLRDQVQERMGEREAGPELSAEERARMKLLRELSRLQDEQSNLRSQTRKLHERWRETVDDRLAEVAEREAAATEAEALREALDEINDARLGRDARRGLDDAKEALERIEQLGRSEGATALELAEAAEQAARALEQASVGAEATEQEGKDVRRARDRASRLGERLERGLPAPHEVLPADDLAELQRLGERQGGLRKQSRELLDEPMADQLPAPGRKAMRRADRGMEHSAEQLGRRRPGQAVDPESQAWQGLQEAIDSLRRGSPPPPPSASGDASTETERDRSLRDALMEAMREDAPAGYDEPVQRYYEELLR